MHKETPVSLADLADYADKTQNHNNITNCLSLRYNAACCIPLRNLRYLRENTRKSTQSIGKEETPMSPADLADYADKTQNHKTTLTTQNCLSLRNNAACCIPLRDLRNLRENIHERVLNLSAQRNPNISRRSR